MAASGGSFDYLTRRHGVKIDSAVSVEECSLAVGVVVGTENIISASRMNSAIVIFLKTVVLANRIVENGIVVNGIFTPVLPLSTPSKRVTLANVPPFISNEVLAGMLSRYGKLVSQIKMIPIGCKSPLLKHVVSFRRYVYMILQDNLDDLDLALNFRQDEFNYVIFVTTNSMKCFGCGEIGHLIRACPGRVNQTDKNHPPADSGEKNLAQDDELLNVTVALPADIDVPSTSLLQTALPKTVTDKIVEGMPADKPEGREVEAEKSEFSAVNGLSVQAQSEVSRNSDNSGLAGEQLSVNPDQDRVSMMDVDEASFKIPSKRRLKQQHVGNHAKKAEISGGNQSDSESGSDTSECSISCSLPLGGFSSRIYTVQDIKSFLKVTKNARKVRIEEYFPDVLQFMEKTKAFKSDGDFTKQEWYRLKRILTKLNTQSRLNVSNDSA